jgi:Radical SAM superfamily/4Fe-4S single cluster domain
VANILLTTKCTRSCPYCFAEKEMRDSSHDEHMSWENLIYIADFLHACGEPRISLLGGEPTLHPDFVDYVLYLVERNFHVTVFSNGIMSPPRLEELKTHLTVVPGERLNFVCNLNNPIQTPADPDELLKIHHFLEVMGPWTTVGFTVYRIDYDLKFIFDLVNRYGMRHHLRLGIAHPVPGKESGFIRPHEIGAVIARLYSFRHLFDRFRVKPGLDCGFPLCAFTDEQLGWLRRLTPEIRFGCGPAIDISPDMSVYCCFPFSNFRRRSIFEFDSMKQIIDYYSEMQSQFRVEQSGIYEACDGCVHHEEKNCSGGGICQLLNRFVNEAPVRMPGIENELAKYRMSV